MRLRVTPRATSDLTDIADYIRERNPELGRRQSVEGVCKLVVRRYGYLAYYSIDRTRAEIVILTIRHPARRPLYSDT